MKFFFATKLYLVLVLFPFTANAVTSVAESLAKADQAFQNAHFEEARDLYGSILNDPISTDNAAFYYNYGSTLAKTGNIGGAYAFLEKALLLSPWDGDIRNNVEFVRKQLSPAALSAQPSGVLNFVPEEVFHLPLKSCIAICLAALCGFLCLRLFRPKLVSVQWIVGAVFLASLGVSSLYLLSNAEHLAIVSLKEAKLRSGPSNSFPEIMNLESGSLVRTGESRDGWNKLYFSLSTDRSHELVGWIDSRALILLKD